MTDRTMELCVFQFFTHGSGLGAAKDRKTGSIIRDILRAYLNEKHETHPENHASQRRKQMTDDVFYLRSGP